MNNDQADREYTLTIKLTGEAAAYAQQLADDLKRTIEQETGAPVSITVSTEETQRTTRRAARLFVFKALDSGIKPTAPIVQAWAERFDLFPETIEAIIRLWKERQPTAGGMYEERCVCGKLRAHHRATGETVFVNGDRCPQFRKAPQ